MRGFIRSSWWTGRERGRSDRHEPTCGRCVRWCDREHECGCNGVTVLSGLRTRADSQSEGWPRRTFGGAADGAGVCVRTRRLRVRTRRGGVCRAWSACNGVTLCGLSRTRRCDGAAHDTVAREWARTHVVVWSHVVAQAVRLFRHLSAGVRQCHVGQGGGAQHLATSTFEPHVTITEQTS